MIKTAFFALSVAVLVALAISLTRQLGIFKHFYKHHPGTCRRVNGPYLGSEDLYVTKDGVAFITSGVALPPIDKYFFDLIPKGKILIFDFSNPDQGLTELNLTNIVSDGHWFNPAIFRPHGLDVLEDPSPKGEHLVYVVNHLPNKGGDRLEKFRYLPKTKTLQHERSFTSPKFHTLNDVTVVKEDLFYLTDFMYTHSVPWGAIEFVLPLHLGSVLFYNGDAWGTAVSGLRKPNGIVLSSDHRYAYLNHDEHIGVYSRNTEDNSLRLIQNVQIHFMGDNCLLTQSEDALICGGHPILLDLFKHFDYPDTTNAPSKVIRLPLNASRHIVEEEVTELFYDHGHLLSGSSVATVYDNKLLIGSVLHNLVLCDLNGPLKKRKKNV